MTQGLHDPEPDDWSVIPDELQSRHRLMLPDGSYGGSDRRAIAALMKARFVDPAIRLGKTPRTCGYYNDDELWDHRSDHLPLAEDLAPGLVDYHFVDTQETEALSDHLPGYVDVDLALCA